MFPLNYIQPHQQPERTTKLLLYLLLLISGLLNQVDGYAKKKKILEQELVSFLLLVMFQTNLTDDVVNYVTVVGYYYLYQLSHNGVESIVRYGLIKDIRYQKHKPYTWNMKINTSVAIVLGQTGFINSSFSFFCIKCSETQHLSYYLGFWGCFQNSSANFVGTCYPRK